jgi:xanthine dehydrogenase YagR molybdenum-binding subunit
MNWAEACRLIPDDRLTASESEVGNFWNQPTQSEAVQFAEVEVDVETGIVRVAKIVALQEMGQPVNRLTAENQVIGAVIQGLSYALFENRILDRRTGAMVNANMDQYRVAGPVDIPEIVPILWKERDDAWVNSLGEPPVIPTAGAIATAVADAIGVQVRRLPLTPAQVLAALARSGSARL